MINTNYAGSRSLVGQSFSGNLADSAADFGSKPQLIRCLSSANLQAAGAWLASRVAFYCYLGRQLRIYLSHPIILIGTKSRISFTKFRKSAKNSAEYADTLDHSLAK